MLASRGSKMDERAKDRHHAHGLDATFGDAHRFAQFCLPSLDHSGTVHIILEQRASGLRLTARGYTKTTHHASTHLIAHSPPAPKKMITSACFNTRPRRVGCDLLLDPRWQVFHLMAIEITLTHHELNEERCTDMQRL